MKGTVGPLAEASLPTVHYFSYEFLPTHFIGDMGAYGRFAGLSIRCSSRPYGLRPLGNSQTAPNPRLKMWKKFIGKKASPSATPYTRRIKIIRNKG